MLHSICKRKKVIVAGYLMTHAIQRSIRLEKRYSITITYFRGKIYNRNVFKRNMKNNRRLDWACARKSQIRRFHHSQVLGII